MEPFSRTKDPVMVLRHAGLERASKASAYRSKCPVCGEGVLLVARDQKTLELQAEDCCILCGQRFLYLDIEEMREKERI